MKTYIKVVTALCEINLLKIMNYQHQTGSRLNLKVENLILCYMDKAPYYKHDRLQYCREQSM